MGSVSPKYQGKNGNVQTYEAVGSLILGGQLIIPTTGNTLAGVQAATVAGAGALNCIGVASADAVPAASQGTYAATTAGYDAGYPYVDTSVPDPTFAAYTDVVIKVTYVAGAVAFGDRLKCGAAGAVAKWITGTDLANLIIGSCAEPGGTAGGVVALAKIYPL